MSEPRGLNVLVVDDSPAMRSFIKRALALSGLELGCVAEAGDGCAALDSLAREPIDLVLSDINMPNMNGEELIRHMSEDPHFRSTPVVVVSTDSTPLRVSRLMSLGARGYIEKPFRPEALRSEIDRVLESSNA